MGKTTDFPDISSGYPDFSAIPTSNEMLVTVAGRDFNVSIQSAFAAAVAMGLAPAVAADLADQINGYISGGGGGGGGGFPLLDEDDFASNSATAAPSQQSTKAYVDGAVAAVTPGADSITNAMLANVGTGTIKGRATAGAGDPEDLTPEQVRAILNVEAGATGDQTPEEVRDGLATLTGDARQDQSTMKGFTGSNHGGLVLQGIAAALSPTALQYPRRNAANNGWEMKTLGSAAELTAMPAGAPASASSSSGAITLDYLDTDRIQTVTTENITAITFANIAAYATVVWRVKQTTARNITFPAGTKVAGNGGLLLYSGVANSTINFLIYNDNGTYEVIVGDAGVVGA